jgi:hypothetical protein
MLCKQCSSETGRTFNGEVAIHFSGLEGLEKPISTDSQTCPGIQNNLRQSSPDIVQEALTLGARATL